jgi:soluble lytic murein transglycosylase-like protein
MTKINPLLSQQIRHFYQILTCSLGFLALYGGAIIRETMSLTRARLTRNLRALSVTLHRRPARLALAASMVCALSLAGYALRPAPTPVMLPVAMVQPSGLSDMDRTLYAGIFNAQEAGDTATADTLISQLENQVLLGHVLASRYLAAGSDVSKEELAMWLSNYGDHPQAARIAALARQKGAEPEQLAFITQSRPLKGDGYVFHLGRTTMPDSWYRGLRLWKEAQYKQAGDLFAAIGADGKLNSWQRSAGSYWQYRSLLQQKNNGAANKALAKAAAEPLTFYGQLALARQGAALPVQARAPHVSYSLREDPAVQRASAFAQLDMQDEAETELRALYSRLGEHDRTALVALSAEMGLTNLQVRLAQMPQLSASESVFASYPLPQPMVDAAAPIIDPSLVLAVARHESGFRDEAKSGAGAVGMMQMLPSTAKHVLKQAERMTEVSLADNEDDAHVLSITQRLNDAGMSARLGAAYLRMLTREPSVGDNLMKMLAAYNAGPGAVQNWNKTARTMKDPLLYLESIPYPETHNYVLQVMAHYWIYQSIQGQQPASLNELAHGQWPTIS